MGTASVLEAGSSRLEAGEKAKRDSSPEGGSE
jgi:hypothetical protein